MRFMMGGEGKAWLGLFAAPARGQAELVCRWRASDAWRALQTAASGAPALAQRGGPGWRERSNASNARLAWS